MYVTFPCISFSYEPNVFADINKNQSVNQFFYVKMIFSV